MTLIKKPIKLIKPEWKKQSAETNGAWNAFRIYLHFEGGVSLRYAYQYHLDKQSSKSGGKRRVVKDAPSNWYLYRRIFKWDERVDSYLENERKKEKRQAQKKKRQLREEQWDDREALRGQARQMLDWTLVEKSLVRTEYDENGKPISNVYVIKPAGWTKNTAAEMLKLANKLANESIGP